MVVVEEARAELGDLNVGLAKGINWHIKLKCINRWYMKQICQCSNLLKYLELDYLMF
jgi:hypothetical protein